MRPSRIASMVPWMLDRGDLNSCATSATRLRRCVSARSMPSAMELKVRASWPTSSSPRTGTRWDRSPPPSRRAAPVRVRTGARALLDIMVMSSRPPPPATRPAQRRERFTAWESLDKGGSANASGRLSEATVSSPTSRFLSATREAILGSASYTCMVMPRCDRM